MFASLVVIEIRKRSSSGIANRALVTTAIQSYLHAANGSSVWYSNCSTAALNGLNTLLQQLTPIDILAELPASMNMIVEASVANKRIDMADRAATFLAGCYWPVGC